MLAVKTRYPCTEEKIPSWELKQEQVHWCVTQKQSRQTASGRSASSLVIRCQAPTLGSPSPGGPSSLSVVATPGWEGGWPMWSLFCALIKIGFLLSRREGTGQAGGAVNCCPVALFCLRVSAPGKLTVDSVRPRNETKHPWGKRVHTWLYSSCDRPSTVIMSASSSLQVSASTSASTQSTGHSSLYSNSVNNSS